MSKYVRTRPLREETQQRLFAAAARVITEVGVGAATIDQIATSAGFTRGAFYSNFADKDDLLVAMLANHLQRSNKRNRDLVVAHPDPASFVDALRSSSPTGDDPLHDSPELQIELTMHVSRNPELRPALAERLQIMRNLVGDLASETLEDAGIEHELSRDQLGMILVALEDGLRLHRLIDPASTPDDAFSDALAALLMLISER